MATLTSTRYRFRPLSLQPINFSLTEGTTIPPPPSLTTESLSPLPFFSPSPTTDLPRRSGSPPAPHGGPLSSHPTTPTDFVLDIDFSTLQHRPRSQFTASPAPFQRQTPSPSPLPPQSPISNSSATTSSSTKRSSSSRHSLRKSPLLRSLSNLYTASSESLAALYQRGEKRPSAAPGASMHGTSGAVSAPTSVGPSPRPSYSRKASGSWFKRRSGMWGDANVVWLVEETVVPMAEGENGESVGDLCGDVGGKRRSMSGKEMLAMATAPVLPSLRVMGLGEDVGDLGAGEWLKDIH